MLALLFLLQLGSAACDSSGVQGNCVDTETEFCKWAPTSSTCIVFASKVPTSGPGSGEDCSTIPQVRCVQRCHWDGGACVDSNLPAGQLRFGSKLDHDTQNCGGCDDLIQKGILKSAGNDAAPWTPKIKDSNLEELVADWSKPIDQITEPTVWWVLVDPEHEFMLERNPNNAQAPNMLLQAFDKCYNVQWWAKKYLGPIGKKAMPDGQTRNTIWTKEKSYGKTNVEGVYEPDVTMNQVQTDWLEPSQANLQALATKLNGVAQFVNKPDKLEQWKAAWKELPFLPTWPSVVVPPTGIKVQKWTFEGTPPSTHIMLRALVWSMDYLQKNQDWGDEGFGALLEQAKTRGKTQSKVSNALTDDIQYLSKSNVIFFAVAATFSLAMYTCVRNTGLKEERISLLTLSDQEI